MSYDIKLKENQPKIKAYVSSKIYNKADASDIVQNINRVIINKKNSFDSNKCFEAWAIGIAKYQIKDFLKRQKKLPDIVPLDFGLECEGFVSKENPSLWLSDVPFADIVESERRELSDQIRAVLTKKQKIIFDYTVQGIMPAEIASILNMKLQTVRTLKFRMVQKAKSFILKLNALNNYDYQTISSKNEQKTAK